MGIQSFGSKDTEEIASGIVSKRSRHLLPLPLHKVALKKIHIIRAANKIEDIANFPGLRLEKLKGNRSEEYSIRINSQYRICFYWKNGDAYRLIIEDYH